MHALLAAGCLPTEETVSKALSLRSDLSSHSAWTLGIVMLGLMLTLGACNTMSGAGEDIEAAGDAMSDTAEDTEDEM
jgi:predicted small secreted protein